MLHSFDEFADRIGKQAQVLAKDAAKIFDYSFSCHDAIEYLGLRPQAVNGAVTALRHVSLPQRLLEHCAETHALIYVHGEQDLFAKQVNHREERLMLPKRSVRAGFNFRFGLVLPGYRLVRLAPHHDTFGLDSVEQENAIGHVQSGESVASAYVAAFAALGLHAKYGIGIVDEGNAARTSDGVGASIATLAARGGGKFGIEVESDVANPDVGAITMIEERH